MLKLYSAHIKATNPAASEGFFLGTLWAKTSEEAEIYFFDLACASRAAQKYLDSHSCEFRRCAGQVQIISYENEA